MCGKIDNTQQGTGFAQAVNGPLARLAIVSRIMSAHGGRIETRPGTSEPGLICPETPEEPP